MHFSRRHAIGALLIGTLTLSACGGWRDSRANPRNWFGGSEEAIAEPVEYVNPLIPESEDRARIRIGRSEEDLEVPTEPITEITDLRIDRTTSGAIVVATGLAKRQGAFNAQLVPIEDEAVDTLSFVFEVAYPETATYRGNDATRTIRAAASLTTQDLRRVNKIRVEGATNARESRR